MSRSLSSYLSNRAELAHDGRIPQEKRDFIRSVAFAEREMARDAGAVETARQTLRAAYHEFDDRYGELTALEGLLASDRTSGMLRERVSCARADVLLALSWIDECRLAMSTAIRQAQQDAAQAAECAA